MTPQKIADTHIVRVVGFILIVAQILVTNSPEWFLLPADQTYCAAFLLLHIIAVATLHDLRALPAAAALADIELVALSPYLIGMVAWLWVPTVYTDIFLPLVKPVAQACWLSQLLRLIAPARYHWPPIGYLSYQVRQPTDWRVAGVIYALIAVIIAFAASGGTLLLSSTLLLGITGLLIAKLKARHAAGFVAATLTARERLQQAADTLQAEVANLRAKLQAAQAHSVPLLITDRAVLAALATIAPDIRAELEKLIRAAADQPPPPDPPGPGHRAANDPVYGDDDRQQSG